MESDVGREAAIPNPALQPWNAVVGDWTTVGRHPLLPGVELHGRASFAWLEGGAFLIMRTEIDEPQVPSGIAIVGSDDVTGEQFMLYYDERRVSRRYAVTWRHDGWQWSRDAPDMSQRFTVTISDDGRSMLGQGQMSRDGTSWEGDLELTYRRISAKHSTRLAAG